LKWGDFLKIILIQAGTEEKISKEMGFGNRNRINMPMLGLLYIEAITPRDMGIEVIDETHGLIKEFEKADIVGISGMTVHANRMYFLAEEYRKLGCYVVLGGIHVSFMQEEALQHADTVMVGEGELIWAQFIDDFKNGVPRRIYQAAQATDIQGLPAPKRRLLEGDAYKMPAGTLNSIAATRGCPNNCSFCCVKNMFGRSFRMRPIEDVIEEMEGMDDSIVIFQDDNFIGNIAYAKRLLWEMSGLRRVWGAQAGINVAGDDEMLALLEKSGCNTLFIGIESIDSKNLINVHKSGVNKIERYEEYIRKIKGRGIRIFGSFIVGLDDDDESTFDQIYEFACKNGIDFPLLNCLTPFPGTELFAQLKSEGRIIDYNWDRYNLTQVVIKPKKMSPQTLQYRYDTLSYYLGKLALKSFKEWRR